MDILIPHSWLKDFLKTEATPQKIAECLSLCGPSVEKVEKVGKDFVYSIEVTTNRVDSVGVYGIAREAVAILPRFGIKASLQPTKVHSAQGIVPACAGRHRVNWLDVEVDQKLCPRFTAILIKNVQLKKSPAWMEQRLKLIGLRPINNVVDISNYLMHELGQPLHTFDYDKIKIHDILPTLKGGVSPLRENVVSASIHPRAKARGFLEAPYKMILRASRAGEKIITLDDKEYTLPGGDIVIEDGEGRLIDLAGIMGGKLSAVDEKTKNVLLFVQTYNPAAIRQTSMALAKRSEAASLFEKGLDPELVEVTIRRAIDLFVKLCQGRPAGEILDIYPSPYKGKTVDIDVEFINERLGVKIPKREIIDILESLGFKISGENTLSVSVPSFRSNDIGILEDIVEEVARLYGYYNLPSAIMNGALPEPLENPPFDFEIRLKRALKGWGGVEVYTLSLVSKEKVSLAGHSSWALKLKNPLGSDSEYLRQSIAPSLVAAVRQNPGQKPIHLFEMANVYLPVRAHLPEEKMMLAGIFANYDYRQAKGIVEALLLELGTDATWTAEDNRGFLPNQRLIIKNKKGVLGEFGTLDQGYFYYEFGVELLRVSCSPASSYSPIPKYPAQIEDLSLVFPSRTRVGDVIETIKKADRQIVSLELVDIYEDTRTLRVAYQNLNKTLTDKEVKRIRNKILGIIKRKFGVILKP